LNSFNISQNTWDKLSNIFLHLSHLINTLLIGIIWRLVHRYRELALATRFWFTICHCFPIMSSHGLSFKWLLRPPALYYIACIIHTTNVASRKIHILCIKFKIRTLWLLTQLYVMVAFYSRIEITWITALFGLI
jgi:hypothetical protein